MGEKTLNALSAEFQEALKKEAEKSLDYCNQLNSDIRFKETVSSVVDKAGSDFDYLAQHLLLHDLVKIYNEYVTLCQPVPIETKFTLLFLYEFLQGRDLSKQYNMGRIQQLVTSPQFDRNIDIITTTAYFYPGEGLKDQFVLPVVLQKMGHGLFLSLSATMNRMAALMVKANSAVSDKEEAFLKQVGDRITNPKLVSVHAGQTDIPPDDTLEKVMSELKELVGLEGIKKNVEDLTNFLRVQGMREEKGLKTSNTSLHCVFMGPPGTGKTTIARLLGRIFKHLGYIQRGHLVETDRSGLVAGYVGQTAIKADEVIKSSLGGVLFIDEAYSLAGGGLNDYGREAIEILLKRMEDHRHNLVVVVAGYPEETQIFIQSNPGLQSRFNRYFTFDHFTALEMMQIYKLISTKADFKLTELAEEKLMEIFERLYEKRNRSFGNARAIRNLFEKIIERQANRIVTLTPITEELLMTITEDDIPEIMQTVKEIILFEEPEEDEAAENTSTEKGNSA